MYRIKIPEPVEVGFPLGIGVDGKLVEKKEQYTMEKFLNECLDSSPGITKGSSNVRMFMKLATIIEKSEEKKWTKGKYLDLDSQYYSVLKKGLEEIQWKPSVVKQIIVFFDELENAKNIDLEETNKKSK